MHSKLEPQRARLGRMEDPGSLPSGSTSWGRSGGGGGGGGGASSQSRLFSLAFAKGIQRRLGPRGTTGPLLRKEG